MIFYFGAVLSTALIMTERAKNHRTTHQIGGAYIAKKRILPVVPQQSVGISTVDAYRYCTS